MSAVVLIPSISSKGTTPSPSYCERPIAEVNIPTGQDPRPPDTFSNPAQPHARHAYREQSRGRSRGTAARTSRECGPRPGEWASDSDSTTTKEIGMQEKRKKNSSHWCKVWIILPRWFPPPPTAVVSLTRAGQHHGRLLLMWRATKSPPTLGLLHRHNFASMLFCLTLWSSPAVAVVGAEAERPVLKRWWTGMGRRERPSWRIGPKPSKGDLATQPVGAAT